MKKRILSVVLVVLLAVSMILPVSAEEGRTYVIDERGMLSEFIPEFNAKASAIADTYGINVTILLTESTSGMGTPYYSEQIYQGLFGEEPGIMLIESTGDQEWFIYKCGDAEEMFSEEDEGMLWDAFNARGYYDDAVEDYFLKAQEMLEEKTGIPLDLSAIEAPVTGGSGLEENEISDDEMEAQPLYDIPADRLLPRLVDNADLLDDEEETALLEKLDEISERQKLDVVIATVESMDGATAEAFADDFFDYNGYGFGEERDGILLLISMEERDWAMSTCGYGITAFTDAGLNYISGKFTPKLSDGDYSGAFTVFADLCDDFITQAKTGEPYDTGNLPKGTVSPIWIPIDLAIGFAIAFIWGRKKKLDLKSVRRKTTATDYTVPGSMRVTLDRERMVNKMVTTRTIQRDTSSGGSSTHTSSSGTTHGGSSGKF